MRTPTIGKRIFLRFFIPAAAAAYLGLEVGAAAGEPLSVDACVRLAMTNNPTIRKSDLALQNRRLDTILAKARFAVRFSGSADHKTASETTSESAEIKKEFPAGITASSKISLTDAREDAADRGSLSITLSKIILGGGSYRESMLEIDNSLIDEIIAMNALSKSKREIEYRVRQGYCRIIRNRQLLKIRELRLDAARRNLEVAVERENPLDVATAGIDVPESEAAVLSVRKDIEASLDALRELMGMDASAELEIDLELDYREAAVNPTHDLGHCLENHEDMLNARLEKRKAENELAARRAHVWPQVTLSGTASRASEGSQDLGGDLEYTVGLSLSWELGASAERAKVQKAMNDLRARDIALDALRLAKENTVRDLGRRLEEARGLVRLQEERVKNATRLAQLYADRWENGEIDILEYVRSQNALQDSTVQLINAKTNYLELLAQYRFEVGR